MILDTAYLLPLARNNVDTDLLRAIADRKVGWKLEEVTVSMISIFEGGIGYGRFADLF